MLALLQSQGGLAYSQYVKGSALHQTYNGALVAQGTSETTIQGNVAYDVLGHAFKLEDGSETGHVLDGNLAILMRASLAQRCVRRCTA